MLLNSKEIEEMLQDKLGERVKEQQPSLEVVKESIPLTSEGQPGTISTRMLGRPISPWQIGVHQRTSKDAYLS